MKYNLTLLVLLSSTFIMAQNTTETVRKHAIKANLLSPIYNTLNISYEGLLKSNGNSFAIGATYMDFNDFGNNNYSYNNTSMVTSTNVKGVSLTYDYKIHFTNNGFEGAYLAPFARMLYYERNAVDYGTTAGGPPNFYQDYYKEEFKYLSIGLGFTVGYQFVINNRVSFDFFGGPAYQILLSEDRTTTNLSNGLKMPNQDETLLANAIPNRYIKGYGLRGGITIGFLF